MKNKILAAALMLLSITAVSDAKTVGTAFDSSEKVSADVYAHPNPQGGMDIEIVGVTGMNPGSSGMVMGAAATKSKVGVLTSQPGYLQSGHLQSGLTQQQGMHEPTGQHPHWWNY